MKKMILFLLVLLMTAATGTWAQTTHTVKMKSGTKDAANWTIATGSEPNVRTATGDATEGLTGVAKGDEVRLTYSGRLKVKSVKATNDGWNGYLSNIPASAIASDGYTVIVPDGTTLTGTLNGSEKKYKIVIPDGATVTLSDATINGWHDGVENSSESTVAWAGITCEGNATIILADNSANTVKGFYMDYPGIYIAEGKTLTIKGGSEGTGSLTASPWDGGGTSDSWAAGIGGGYKISCGNILIEGGVITATGGRNAAGIGGGYGTNQDNHSRCGNITITGGTVKATGRAGGAGIGSGNNYSDCGDILISGGTVEATGGSFAVGIGSGYEYSSCGTVTITKDLTKVTATSGSGYFISIGQSTESSCGTVTIGCELDSDGKPKSGTGTVYYDGSAYQNGGATYLAQETLTLVNLGKLTGNYEAPNGTTLFGTLKGSEQPYKVSIADNATVTLDGVDIEGVNNDNCKWAGLNCAGTATIILNDGSENTVKGFHKWYPGIYVPESKTLTIKGGTLGNGKLTASPFDSYDTNCHGTGIGGGYETPCGNINILGGEIMAIGSRWCAGIGSGTRSQYGYILISGGIVTAFGGDYGAGIGCGSDATGGYITISGGTVEATGGNGAPGIGSGKSGFTVSSCGDITITKDVKSVTATKGESSPNSIGKGRSDSSCGTVTIGCTLDGDGNPIGGTVYDNGVEDSPFTYTPPTP